jgi:ComF family protein
MRNILNDLLCLFYPNLCLLCKRPLIVNEKYLCLYCLCDLPKTNYHVNKTNPAADLFAGYAQVSDVTAFLFFERKGVTQRLIHALKYKGNYGLAEYLGRMAALDLKKESVYASVDAIIPIPLHPKKERQRGYNQSEHIAKGIASVYACEINNLLIQRITHTVSQTRKTAYERHLNVEKIFQLTDPETLHGKHILLIDDVITTGATISSCIDTLISVPEIKISIFALAIARGY